MILYNVTLNIETTIEDDFLIWLHQEYIPRVMQTGLFSEYKILRLLSEHGETPGTITYSVQYFLADVKDFLNYSENFAPAVQKATQEKFGNQMMAFRTLLEVVD